jgi:uncharacterized protein
LIRAMRFAAIGLGAFVLAGNAAAETNYWYTVAIAASQNSTDGVKSLLLQGGNDPDGIDSTSGRTALDYAASFNNIEMAKLLLDHGAHVDARDTSGSTALHWAAERGNLEVMRMLLESKANVDAANRQGITPLMLAASHTQPAAVRFLLAHGADPKKQDFSGHDAFGWAAGKPSVVQALNAKR